MPGWSAPFSVTGQSNQGSQEQAVMSRENFGNYFRYIIGHYGIFRNGFFIVKS